MTATALPAGTAANPCFAIGRTAHEESVSSLFD